MSYLTLSLLLVAGPLEGFTPLFNGKDLKGWHGWAIHDKGASPADVAKLTPEQRAEKVAAWTADAKKHWRVENGELINDGHGAFLATDREYGDIMLSLEYRTVPKADSGIYLRGVPQVQIWDSTEKEKFKLGADKGSGGLWNNSPGAPGKDPLVRADRPFGEWNKLNIIQVGERVRVSLNGELVVDFARMENYWDRKKPLPKTGPILLQTHGGEIRFRNLQVRELEPEVANAMLAEPGFLASDGPFNGHSFAGWAGATDGYEIKRGHLFCKPGQGGNLFTEKQYSDFVAQLEYRLPAGGNNGLLLRYPGTGDGAYEGLCEIQVLDDDHPKYAKLDPRQFNGSAYGMVAALRGYHRPAGEWNFQKVTAIGPKVTVELNGYLILDTDLSKVTEFMGGKPHPGLTRTKGHFGFAGHGDPVEFKGIFIRDLTKPAP